MSSTVTIISSRATDKRHPNQSIGDLSNPLRHTCMQTRLGGKRKASAKPAQTGVRQGEGAVAVALPFPKSPRSTDSDVTLSQKTCCFPPSCFRFGLSSLKHGATSQLSCITRLSLDCSSSCRPGLYSVLWHWIHLPNVRWCCGL